MFTWFKGLSLHLRIAIILAPFLAILGYGLADTWLRLDAPQAEQTRQQVAVKALVVNGQCVLDTNQCQLSQDEMELELRSAPASSPELVRLNIASSQHIRGLKLSLLQGDDEQKLVAQSTEKTDRWFVEFPRKQLKQPEFVLRIALAQTKRVYLAEFKARF